MNSQHSSNSKDATAAPQYTELGDGYKAALINFGYIANAVLSTDDVVEARRNIKCKGDVNAP